ncbi:MAG: hypothetical protein GY861_23895 [bacterium]|nr:hypothetical protein [bacterium]
MFKRFRKSKGQSTVEYAVLIAIVIAALISIQMYIKRGVQGRLKSAADDIGDQYSSGNTNFRKDVVTSSSTRETFTRGVTRSELLAAETTNIDISGNSVDVDHVYYG